MLIGYKSLGERRLPQYTYLPTYQSTSTHLIIFSVFSVPPVPSLLSTFIAFPALVNVNFILKPADIGGVDNFQKQQGQRSS